MQYKINRYIQLQGEMPRPLWDEDPEKLYTLEEVEELSAKFQPETVSHESRLLRFWAPPDQQGNVNRNNGYFIYFTDDMLSKAVCYTTFKQASSSILIPDIDNSRHSPGLQ